MRLENELALATDLETGLGELHWMAVGYDSSLRLRLPLCGITSYGLAEAYRSIGVDVELIESSPGLIGEENSKHVFLLVDTENGKYIVDPTFSQFLDSTGLSPGYVLFGGKNLFPERKIAVVAMDEGGTLATELADVAVYFRAQRRKIEDVYFNANSTMDKLSRDEMEGEFKKIWDPANFDTFIPRKPEVAQVGQKLARFILPEHVKLVA